MTENEKIEYFKILLSNISDIGSFNISTCVPEANVWGTINLEKEQRDKQQRLNNALKNFGIAHKYFEKANEFSYRLTTKGIEAKKLGGHLEYEEYIEKINSKRLYNEPWIGYLIAFITLLFAVYQGYQNHSLEKDISFSEKNIETLKTELDSLNVQFQFLENKFSDLKMKIEQKK